MRRIPAITSLRALAAGLVLLSHVAFWTGGANTDVVGRLLARGDCGVAVFFAISAFLLTLPSCRDGAGGLPLRDYARRRAARIYPAYAVALAAVVLVAAAVPAEGTGGIGKVLAHVVLIQGYTQETYRGFTQSWSLTTEVTFYVLVPWIAAWLRRCVRTDRSPVTTLVVVGSACLVLQTWSASSGEARWGWLSTSVLGHGAWFVVGIVLAWMVGRGHRAPISAARAGGVALSAYVLAATSLGGPVDLATPSALQACAKELLYAIVAAALVASAAYAGAAWQRRWDTPLWQQAGETSYGVFLWHVLILDVLFTTLNLKLFHVPFLMALVPTVLFSGAVAWLSWTALEQPVIAAAHRRR